MSKIKHKGQWQNLEITYRDNDILFVDPVESGELDIDAIKNYYHYLNSVVGENKVLFLTDMRTHYINLPKNVLEYIASDPYSKKIRLADAIVVKSLPNRLIANFYIRFFKPNEPTKLFNSLDSAEEWLFKKKNEYLKSNNENR